MLLPIVKRPAEDSGPRTGLPPNVGCAYAQVNGRKSNRAITDLSTNQHSGGRSGIQGLDQYELL